VALSVSFPAATFAFKSLWLCGYFPPLCVCLCVCVCCKRYISRLPTGFIFRRLPALKAQKESNKKQHAATVNPRQKWVALGRGEGTTHLTAAVASATPTTPNTTHHPICIGCRELASTVFQFLTSSVTPKRRLYNKFR